MTGMSKAFFDDKKQQHFYSCYEVGHTWNHSCKNSAIELFIDTAIAASKVYIPFYVISYLLKRKKFSVSSLKRLLFDACKSTIFLSYNASGFLATFCLLRKLTGRYFSFSSFVAGTVASFIAINFERPSRRQALALYVLNVASETLFRMLQSRGIVRTIPYGDVILMCVASSILTYMHRQNRLQGVMSSVLNFLIGKQCDQMQPSAVVPDRMSAMKNVLVTSYVYKLIASNPNMQKLRRFGIKAVSYPHSKICVNDHSCICNSIKNSLNVFLFAYIGRVIVSIVTNIRKIIGKPGIIAKSIKNNSYIRFAMFLSSFVFLYHTCQNLQRRLIGSDSSRDALLSGFIAGLSVLFHRSPSVAVYLFWKSVEALWAEYKSIYPWLRIPYGTEILYSLSTGLLLHAGICEAHNIRPTYNKFLLQITNDKLRHLNRHLVKDLGKERTKFYPKFPVVNDLSKTSLKYREILKKYESQGLAYYL